MSFANILKEQAQTACLNPINRKHRGFKKAKEQNIPCQPFTMQTPNQETPKLCFSSLSKNKDRQFSQGKFKELAKKAASASLLRNHAKKIRHNCSVSRKLFNDSRSSSKENYMNFSNIVKNSREKDKPQLSILKKYKVISEPPRQRPTFNKLRNRVINNGSPQKVPSTQQQIAQRQDAVVISMQNSVKNQQLDMSPCL